MGIYPRAKSPLQQQFFWQYYSKTDTKIFWFSLILLDFLRVVDCVMSFVEMIFDYILVRIKKKNHVNKKVKKQLKINNQYILANVLLYEVIRGFNNDIDK